ncbi:MAG: hypothetical protein ACREFO_19780 [Acetobacteraceae bacterium]
MAMQVERLFLLCCGFEDDGNEVKVYLESPDPQPSISRQQGVRTPLFHLFVGEDAEAIRRFVSQYRTWDLLRVPQAFTRERGVQAVRIAWHWHCGKGCPIYELASTRTIHGERHREQLRQKVNALIAEVIENPVRPGEYEELVLLREVIVTAPLDTELAASSDIFV